MALSVDYLYQFSLKLIRKNQSGSINGTEFGYFWNDAQFAYIADLLGRFQMRSNGKSGANTGLILNETISTKLAPFTKNASLAIVSGVVNKPTDLLYDLALRINNNDVDFITHGQIASVINSTIDPPSITDNKYYSYEYENTYKFLPTTVTSASLDYIIAPTKVVWGFTYDGNGRQVYSTGASTQSQWDDITNMEITKRMLSNIGVSLKDNDFKNFGDKTIITGE